MPDSMANPPKIRKRDAKSSEEDNQRFVKAIRLKNDLILSSPQSNEPKCPNSTRALRAKSYQRPTRARPSHVLQTNPTLIKSGHVNEEIFSTPEKPKLEKRNEERLRSQDAACFFSRQTHLKPKNAINQIPTQTTSFRQKPSSTEVENDEMISDWEEDDLEFMTQSSSLIKQAIKKRANVRSTFELGSINKELSSGSQKFLQKPNLPLKATDEKDIRPWAERFAPTCLEELAVHKRKVADTRKWLEEVMGGRRKQKLLLLKGAAGTGKTITLKLIAASMNCEVLEWQNPVGSAASSDGFLSMSAQFEEFLGRGARYGQLDLFSSHEQRTGKKEKSRLNSHRKIILIEEFPNTFTSSSTLLQSFRSSLLQFLTYNFASTSMNSREPSNNLIIPIVMIISETLLTTSTASADSFTAHRLLGPTLLQHPGIEVIEFNPIAPTLLAKALQVILQKEARISGRKKVPGSLLLKKFGEIGDIRSAIGCLEFLCLRGDSDGALSAKVSFNKTSKNVKSTELTPMELDSLCLITRREASLGIFHAVARVVYNRRDEQASKLPLNHDPEKMPSFLTHNSRPKRSTVSVNDLVDETGTDTQTFIAALHENYLLSCEAAPSCFEFSSLDHVNGCIDSLSDSDLLGSSWHGFSNLNGVGNTGESYLRNEISFQVAVRGVLFSLPDPVIRKPPAAVGLRMGKAREAHNMFYPTSFKLWKVKEEIESVIDICVKNQLKHATLFTRPQAGKTEERKCTSLKPHDSVTSVSPLLSTGNSARKEMLLERLPYMAQILKSKRSCFSTTMKENIVKVTTFIGISRSEEAFESHHMTKVVGENWATDEPGERKRVKKQTAVPLAENSTTGGLAIIQPREKLVLSDDDIED